MTTLPPSNRAESLLIAVLDHSPEDREAFIITACGENAALLADVRALLAAHETMPTGFLAEPAVNGLSDSDLDATIKYDPSTKPSGSTTTLEREGERIGRYKLLQNIGEGGFGTVWMAEQMEPVTRRVALKIIKLGMDTREVIARFEAERQALAMMDHPNIAKVLDAGATDKGRPFFVMELVKGMPITQYCDEAQLGTRERLALFGDVCSAINHAHQKGVIHRDIKPSNVMVTLHGDKPVVKVIDFGIAKATQGKLTDKTLFTRFEQFIGTPVYMSPEQASLSGLDIDTRSDIYALGILLYELLTGKPPFDAKTLASAGFEEMRRIIREVEPPKPSLRLSTIAGDERTTLAKARRIEPEKLGRLVESDLDWIVMKAIDKDRARRYETANAFAQDIAHFLADETVSATPPSAGYQFRKFARRNKAALRFAAGITTVLVAATAVSVWQALRATRAEKKTAESLLHIAAERDATELARRAASEAEELATEQAKRAIEAEKKISESLTKVAAERDAKEQARKDAEDISYFLIDVFRSPDPSRDGRTITMAETLELAAKKLETVLATQPARRAKLLDTLGKTYTALGLPLLAIPLQEKARDDLLSTLGQEHHSTLMAMQNLANTYREARRTDEAIKMGEDLLALRRRLLGSENKFTLITMQCLANAYDDAKRREEALKLREEALPLSRKANGAENPDTLAAMNNLAISYTSLGRVEKAIELLEETLALDRKVLGSEHPDTLRGMANLSNSFYRGDRKDEALKLREEMIPLFRKVLGPEHPETLRASTELAKSYRTKGDVAKAEALEEEVAATKAKAKAPSPVSK